MRRLRFGFRASRRTDLNEIASELSITLREIEAQALEKRLDDLADVRPEWLDCAE